MKNQQKQCLFKKKNSGTKTGCWEKQAIDQQSQSSGFHVSVRQVSAVGRA